MMFILLAISLCYEMNQVSSMEKPHKEETNVKGDVKLLTAKEFQKAINANELLKSHNLAGPLNDIELFQIKSSELTTENVGGKVNRELGDFKGNTLLIGGEHVLPGHGARGAAALNQEDRKRWYEPNVALSKELKNEQSFLAWLQTPEAQANFSDKSWSEKAQKKILELEQQIAKNDKEREKVLSSDPMETYYVLNIAEEVEPDLVASIASLTDTQSIPDHYFENVIFENVDAFVFLNPNTLKNMERLTKIGGTIQISTAASAARLFAIIFHGTKWEHEIEEQYLAQKDSPLFKLGRMVFTLKN